MKKHVKSILQGSKGADKSGDKTKYCKVVIK